MRRAIVGYHLDAAGDWVAELSCGHGQHVRHRPPFQLREWVLEESGRAVRLGTPLECPWCDPATGSGHEPDPPPGSRHEPDAPGVAEGRTSTQEPSP